MVWALNCHRREALGLNPEVKVWVAMCVRQLAAGRALLLSAGDLGER